MDEKNSIAEVVAAAAETFGVSVQQIRGRSMTRVSTDARYLAMYVCRERGEYTSRIAEYFGVTTQAVCAGANRTGERLKIYASLRERYEGMKRLLENPL